MLTHRRRLAAVSFLLLSGLLQPLPVAAAAHSRCEPPAPSSTAVVAHVYDGDTVRLDDGRRVRLIGIDTPEIGRDGKPSEPFAHEARAALAALLANRRVGVSVGIDPRDRHGRTLAHLTLPDGRDVQQVLLEAGLGIVLSVPPNTRLRDCHLAAEQRARQARTGLWRDGIRGPLDAGSLDRRIAGFRIVRGRVERVARSRSSYWLEMGPRFSARVAIKGLDEAGERRVRALAGRVVEVRGYLYGDGERRHVTVQDPAMLVPEPEGVSN